MKMLSLSFQNDRKQKDFLLYEKCFQKPFSFSEIKI